MKKKMIGAVLAIVLMVLVTLPITPLNAQTMAIEDAAQIAVDTLMSQPGIAGVSYDENTATICVYLESQEYATIVPLQIGGYQTEVTVSGRIYALGYLEQQNEAQTDDAQSGEFPFLSRTSHWPFMLGGISFGNQYSDCTGTLGVVDSHGWMVSCAHVIAMDPNGDFLPTGSGTRVYQPGKYDSGSVNVGYLNNYVTLRFGQESVTNPNHADAASAVRTHGIGLIKKELNSNNINWYSVVFTSITPGVGSTVRKSGRTSGVTTNTVHATSVTIDVYYTTTKWARFSDVIAIHQPFIEGGDSGSFVDKSGLFVGIAFAGSSSYGYVCKASYVKTGLGIT